MILVCYDTIVGIIRQMAGEDGKDTDFVYATDWLGAVDTFARETLYYQTVVGRGVCTDCRCPFVENEHAYALVDVENNEVLFCVCYDCIFEEFFKAEASEKFKTVPHQFIATSTAWKRRLK